MCSRSCRARVSASAPATHSAAKTIATIHPILVAPATASTRRVNAKGQIVGSCAAGTVTPSTATMATTAIPAMVSSVAVRNSVCSATKSRATTRGVRRKRLVAASATIAKNTASFIVNSRPYSVPNKAGILPTKYPALIRPDTISAPTLATPSAEKRRIAAAATSIDAIAAVRRALASNSTSPGSAHQPCNRRYGAHGKTPAHERVNSPPHPIPRKRFALRIAAHCRNRNDHHERQSPEHDNRRQKMHEARGDEEGVHRERSVRICKLR